VNDQNELLRGSFKMESEDPNMDSSRTAYVQQFPPHVGTNISPSCGGMMMSTGHSVSTMPITAAMMPQGGFYQPNGSHGQVALYPPMQEVYLPNGTKTYIVMSNGAGGNGCIPGQCMGEYSMYSEPAHRNFEKEQQHVEQMGEYLFQAAQDVKSSLNHFFSRKRPRNSVGRLNSSSESAQNQSQGDTEKDDTLHPSKLSRVDNTSSLPTASGTESSGDSVYESAVAIYRQLRNEIPLLTDAAHDIDAASDALSEKPNEPSIQLGPLVKRAPPGRGRRKKLSVMKTPLPSHITDTLQKQQRNNPMGSPYAGLGLLRPFRVLFVDDSIITLKLTARRLQSAGFCIDTTSDGSDALQRLMRMDSMPYDIVLTDLNMPIMSGAEIARTLRSYEEENKKRGIVRRQFVIGTSSNTDDKSSSLAIASGMDVFLAKPFTPSDLRLFVSVDNRQNTSREGVGSRVEELE